MLGTMRSDEIELYDVRFPLYGNVRRTVVTPFAPKFTVGDFTRDDQIVASSWILSSFSGGLGILHQELPRDADRFWFSTLETRYRNLVLAPQVFQAGTLTGPADVLVEYNEHLYATVGSTVYIWSEGDGDWTAFHTISGTAQACAGFNGELYFITTAGLHRYTGSTWHDYTSAYIPSGYALVEWDGKLFRLGTDNHIYWTIDPDQNNDGTSVYDPLDPGADTNDWEEAGTLHLPAGYARQLIVYFDLTGSPAIHAITRIGVYGYEFAAKKFYETPLTYPVTQSAGKGACVFRGELYVPVGKSGYKYNGSTIQVVSPSKDDGLPAELRGDILSFVPGHAFYFAVLATTISGSDPVEPVFLDNADPLDPFIMSEVTANGAVLASPGASWHTVFDESAGSSMGAALVASIQGVVGNTFRLWISSGAGMYYINLDTGLHNPLQNPNATFEPYGYLETGWTDLGWAEIKKLALSLNIVASGLSDNPANTIAVSAAFDDNDSWELLGTATNDGHTSILLGDVEGKVFRNMRLRIEMTRGNDPRLTPVLNQIVFAFMRRPPMLWGWEVDLYLTKEHHAGLSRSQMIDHLYTLVESKTAGNFVYRDKTSQEIRAERVVVTNINGTEQAGEEVMGRYTVSMVQLEPPNTEWDEIHE